MRITRAQFAAWERAVNARVAAPSLAVNSQEIAKLSGLTPAMALYIYCNYEGLKYGRLPLEHSDDVRDRFLILAPADKEANDG
jgi:hypothetical protein